MVGGFCCARAASGHAAAVPPSRVMKSRRLMGQFRMVDGTTLAKFHGPVSACDTAVIHREIGCSGWRRRGIAKQLHPRPGAGRKSLMIRWTDYQLSVATRTLDRSFNFPTEQADYFLMKAT